MVGAVVARVPGVPAGAVDDAAQGGLLEDDAGVLAPGAAEEVGAVGDGAAGGGGDVALVEDVVGGVVRRGAAVGCMRRERGGDIVSMLCYVCIYLSSWGYGTARYCARHGERGALGLTGDVALLGRDDADVTSVEPGWGVLAEDEVGGPRDQALGVDLFSCLGKEGVLEASELAGVVA